MRIFFYFSRFFFTTVFCTFANRNRAKEKTDIKKKEDGRLIIPKFLVKTLNLEKVNFLSLF
jgi:hypothetical protein